MQEMRSTMNLKLQPILCLPGFDIDLCYLNSVKYYVPFVVESHIEVYENIEEK